MEKINVLAKKWGDSIAIIIPSKVVKSRNISPNDELEISFEKESSLRDLFGALVSRKNAQEFKDESREGWE